MGAPVEGQAQPEAAAAPTEQGSPPRSPPPPITLPDILQLLL